MKIIVDAMGGDNAPLETVKGAVMAAQELDAGTVLVGRGEDILVSLDKLGMKDLPQNVEIVNATETITMEDDPASATKIKADSSMTVGLRLLRDGSGDAMVSAGSTGALLSGATLIVKRIHGIRRAALAPIIPTNGNSGTILVDVGANAECTSEYLTQFAYMGSYLAKATLGVQNPRVGLLNIGAEETKGSSLYKETHRLLKESAAEGRLNFVGNIESRDIMDGVCDVLVCDGFTGNILLKNIEGMAIFFNGEIKKIFNKNTRTKMAASAMKDEFAELRRRIDSSEIGGTALLGISKPVIKAHGSSDAYAIKNAIRQAIDAVKSDVCGAISENVQYMKTGAA